EARQQACGIVSAFCHQFINGLKNRLIFCWGDLSALRRRGLRLDPIRRVLSVLSRQANAMLATPIPSCPDVGKNEIVITTLVLIGLQTVTHVYRVDGVNELAPQTFPYQY